MNESYLSVEEAWDNVQNEASVWDHLTIKDQAFYYQKGDQSIFLSSFNSRDLPTPPYPLKPLGKLLVHFSQFAKILSHCPGTEEVTFYAIINKAQKKYISKKLDEKRLALAAPPLTWRRNSVRTVIKQKVAACLKARQTFAFVDIGSGAGFDSLEIERIMHKMAALTGTSWANRYMSLNIDINSKWLKNNERLAKKIIGKHHHIINQNLSAFEFLSNKSYHAQLKEYDNLIVTCNGFAEFLSDEDLKTLYQGVAKLANSFAGQVVVILPFANKSKKQEAIGNKIGFQFRAKEKDEMLMMITNIFSTYTVSYQEKHSHIVMVIEN